MVNVRQNKTYVFQSPKKTQWFIEIPREHGDIFSQCSGDARRHSTPLNATQRHSTPLNATQRHSTPLFKKRSFWGMVYEIYGELYEII